MPAKADWVYERSRLMRSRHVDRFNHDGEVHGYDDHVADESNPVRDGYPRPSTGSSSTRRSVAMTS